MSSTPQMPDRMPAASPPIPAAADGRWLHDVRNELNTAMMAAAAARRLLQDGDHAEALANVQRTESACYRCAQLLRHEPDGFE